METIGELRQRREEAWVIAIDSLARRDYTKFGAYAYTWHALQRVDNTPERGKFADYKADPFEPLVKLAGDMAEEWNA